MRRPLVVGNWKLNGSYYIINKFIDSLRKKLTIVNNCDVVIAPPEVYLDLVRRIVGDSSNIILGAQNVGINLSGAFTGETSAIMLKDIGVKYVIVGHSERRKYHKESDEFIAKKFKILKDQGLTPILCIGETELEKRDGKTKEVCINQIEKILKIYGEVSLFEDSVVAYEPLWAIGTNNPAVPEQVQMINKFIRSYISSIDTRIAEKIIIQYGGSVDIYNSKELLLQPDIDGLLVGSASLKADNFAYIIKIAEELSNNGR